MGTDQTGCPLCAPDTARVLHRGQLMLVQRLLGQVPHLTRARAAMQAQRAGTTA